MIKVLKHSFCLLMVLLYLGISARMYMPMLVYQAKQSYIAEKLCENKQSKTVKGCNGKCHLKKMMKAVANETAASTNSASDKAPKIDPVKDSKETLAGSPFMEPPLLTGFYLYFCEQNIKLPQPELAVSTPPPGIYA